MYMFSSQSFIFFFNSGCPLEPSNFWKLLRSPPFVLTLDAIEEHVSTSNLCHHPPLKDIILHGPLDGTSLLHIFCSFGAPDHVKRMVDIWKMEVEATAIYYTNPRSYGFALGTATPLFIAAHSRHIAVVQYLVEEKKADVNSRTSYVNWKGGRSPLQGTFDDMYRTSPSLHWPRAIPVAVYLLEVGADPNILERDGSPLWATFPWNTDIIAALIHHGLDLDLRDRSGQTLLHIACKNAQDLPIIQLLLQKGANPNASDVQGDGPLHRLASQSYGDGVAIDQAARLLLLYGAHVDRVNNNRKTAADLWIESNRMKHEEGDLEQVQVPDWCREPGYVPLLKCLSARAVCVNNIPYGEEALRPLPAILRDFCDFH